MMSNVTNLTHAQVADPSKPVDVKTTQSKPQEKSDVTVQISSAAKAALQEAMETPAQTAKEASAGDQQAKKVLAKEEAAVKGAEK